MNHRRSLIQKHSGAQHTEVLISVTWADGDNHPYENFSFISWICSVVIKTTTEKGNTKLLDRPRPLSLTKLHCSAERLKLAPMF